MASSLLYTFRSSRGWARAVSKTLGETLIGARMAQGQASVLVRPEASHRALHTGAASGAWHRYTNYERSHIEELLSSLRTRTRWLSGTRILESPTGGGHTETHAERRARRREAQKAASSLATIEEEEFSAITDRIPQRPMGAVESTSYSLVILAALGFAAAVLYAAFSELIFSPKEYTCFSKTLKKIEDVRVGAATSFRSPRAHCLALLARSQDPRVTIRLGTPMKAYGTESQNRSARQRIPHRIYTDDQGREHVQLQFVAKGPSGRAQVHADMYEDAEATGGWRYHYLYLTVESPLAQQVVLVKPYQAGDNEAVA